MGLPSGLVFFFSSGGTGNLILKLPASETTSGCSGVAWTIFVSLVGDVGGPGGGFRPQPSAITAETRHGRKRDFMRLTSNYDEGKLQTTSCQAARHWRYYRHDADL